MFAAIGHLQRLSNRYTFHLFTQFSAHAKEVRGSAPEPQKHAFSSAPTHHAQLVRFLNSGCAARHQEKPGKVLETAHRILMSAREANFQILTAFSFFRNRAILDRRFAALIEPPTELDTLALWTSVSS